MKRARWWIVGSVFVTGSAIAMRWPSERPFTFLGNAPLGDIFIRTDFGYDTAYRTYFLEAPVEQVIDSVRKELEPKGWTVSDLGDPITFFSPELNVMRAKSVRISSSYTNSTVRVEVASPATLRDRVGAWLESHSR